MKNPTTWTKAGKNPAQWTGASRTATSWVNGDVKTSAVWQKSGKNSTPWGINYGPAQPYLYDDVNRPYDSVMYLYDYVADTNTLNNHNITIWNSN